MTPKTKTVIALASLALIGGAACWWWVQDAPRRHSLASLTRLDIALHAGNRGELLDLLVVPAALRGRSAPEQTEFLAKVLEDEISADGLTVLAKQGACGPLKALFPAEAETWAQKAGVNPDDCLAFKLERPGFRAEVVLVADKSAGASAPAFRIVRLNNVRRLADTNL